MKTQFVQFVGHCAISGHRVEVREDTETGAVVLRHERNGKHSGAARRFRDAEHLQSYLDAKGADEAALLNAVLGDMAMTGFPC